MKKPYSGVKAASSKARIPLDERVVWLKIEVQHSETTPTSKVKAQGKKKSTRPVSFFTASGILVKNQALAGMTDYRTNLRGGAVENNKTPQEYESYFATIAHASTSHVLITTGNGKTYTNKARWENEGIHLTPGSETDESGYKAFLEKGHQRRDRFSTKTNLTIDFGDTTFGATRHFKNDDNGMVTYNFTSLLAQAAKDDKDIELGMVVAITVAIEESYWIHGHGKLEENHPAFAHPYEHLKAKFRWNG